MANEQTYYPSSQGIRIGKSAPLEVSAICWPDKSMSLKLESGIMSGMATMTPAQAQEISAAVSAAERAARGVL